MQVSCINRHDMYTCIDSRTRVRGGLQVVRTRQDSAEGDVDLAWVSVMLYARGTSRRAKWTGSERVPRVRGNSFLGGNV